MVHVAPFLAPSSPIGAGQGLCRSQRGAQLHLGQPLGAVLRTVQAHRSLQAELCRDGADLTLTTSGIVRSISPITI